MRDEPDSLADPLTREEVERALRILKNGRTGAENRLVTEMLKTGSRTLIESLAASFNDILQNHLEAPDTWKKVKLKVLLKKGIQSCPKSYRPISTILVFAKLYSTILYNTMKVTLMLESGLISRPPPSADPQNVNEQIISLTPIFCRRNYVSDANKQMSWKRYIFQ